MEVELARLSDATALVSLRDDIARWLTARDIAQWNPGEFSVDWLRSWIHDGCVHVAREPGGIVAAVAVVWDDAEIWGPDPTASAGYVHLLMVDRHRAGRGLGDVMLSRAEDRITLAGRRLARAMTDLQPLIRAVAEWARDRPDVVAVGLAGSHARGTARDSSDVDLVVLIEDPAALLGDDAWLTHFGDVTSVADEDWGAVQSRRVRYRAGPEVEFGPTSPAWAAPPLDPGTARVVRDGFRVIHDPQGLLDEAVQAVVGELVVDTDVVLRPFTVALVPDLITAVRESHAHLQPWMFWATPDYDDGDAAVFVELVESGDEWAYAIQSGDGTFHGICVLNRVDAHNRTANLGFWLRSSSTGRGLATRATVVRSPRGSRCRRAPTLGSTGARARSGDPTG